MGPCKNVKRPEGVLYCPVAATLLQLQCPPHLRSRILLHHISCFLREGDHVAVDVGSSLDDDERRRFGSSIVLEGRWFADAGSESLVGWAVVVEDSARFARVDWEDQLEDPVRLCCSNVTARMCASAMLGSKSVTTESMSESP